MTAAYELKALLGQSEILENESMKNHTTFRIGGPADLLVIPQTEEDLQKGILWCKNHGVPMYIIGNGSNLLVGDQGFRGVIFKVCKTLEYAHYIEQNETLEVEAGAGIMLAKLAKDVSAKGYTGFEFATGIPGTLGGAAAMNAGAYGGEMKQVLRSVRAINSEGQIHEFDVEALELGYRTSRIQKEEQIVISAKLAFSKGDAKAIKERVDELSRQRREKQPLEYPSAGSTFKRPEGYFAGKLIQDAGLKGFSVGDAVVSEKHSGFVVNKGEATAADVKALMEAVDRKVYEMFGVHLEPEVRMIGEF